MSLLRTLAALLMACATGAVSCTATFALAGPGVGAEAEGPEVVVRFLAPFVVGALIAAWSYYLLLVGERDDLKTRRARRAARTRRVPHPLAMSALTALLVLGPSTVFTSTLGDLGGWEELFAALAVGPSILLALPLAIVVGIVTARVRAQSGRPGPEVTRAG